jgi:dynein heavy chain 1, cytosolic
MVEKETVLRTKDEEANSKLSKMVEKQNEAEQRKAVAEEMTAELSKQNEQIRVRKETVQNELSEAEPALIAAKESVQNIRKAQLDEVRALGRPPMAVQLTMEMVCVMIGETSTDWTEIRKVIRRDDFISTVVNFNPMTLTPKLVKRAQEYLNNPELDAAAVDRASKACGPLYMWAQSQISYSTILRKIKPLRDEVEALESKSATLTLQQADAVTQVAELEAAIVTYKAEYASAIRDTETIRAEMSVVTRKVSRAESLLSSLNEEKERWEVTSKTFDIQMSTLIGDSLIAAAFLTYSGIFDHKLRQHMMAKWCDALECKNISFRSDIDVTNYLSSPSEQFLWKSFGCPSDNMAMQNCIILERCYRFPMIVDPSGQAINFLLQKFSDRKIIKTSFLDSSFLKTLATCVRFGTPLLVQDVEALDPVLNPLLNREFQKTGGRTLIRIGSDEIDFSPQFMIILATRNPFAHFAPDLCSRVTMVNFTVTPASLEAQALSRVLQWERPDVDRRRVEIQRLQSEQRVKVRDLEEALLNKISAVQGAILDDDSLVNSLEIIKAEATDINREAQLTAQVMEELRAISNFYEPLAAVMTSVYFSLERLADVNYLYQFSLHFFLNIVERVLVVSGRDDSAAADPKIRVDAMTVIFLKEVCKRVLRSLKFEDKLLFVTRIAQIRTSGQQSKELTEQESNFFLRGIFPVVRDSSILTRCKEAISHGSLSDSQTHQIAALTQLPAFAGLLTSLSNSDDHTQWTKVFSCDDPENQIPRSWIANSTSQERASLLVLMVIRILRPDRVMAAVENYVSSVLGDDFLWHEYAKFNLKEMVDCESNSSSPIMLCSESGQDFAGRIDSLASSLNKNLVQVAMGSPEGFIEAEKYLAHSSKTGGWVLLRNVHLCPDWLTTIEKRLHSYSSNSEFRLFLTCEVTSNLPTSLLRASDMVLVEAPTGVKSALQRFFTTTEGLCENQKPVERSRLFALLAWFNAIVQERRRYVPFGWTKRYEFSEADTRCAVQCINQWVDSVSGSRSNISPELLPWKALRTTLSESVYGGRIDNPFDQVQLLLGLVCVTDCMC